MNDIVGKFNLKKLGIFIFALAILSLKTILFTKLALSNNGMFMAELNIDNKLIWAQISLLVILIVPFLLFKEKNQVKYLVVIDIIYTVLLIAELIYYRDTGYFFGASNVVYPHIGKNIFEIKYRIHFYDLLFLIDIPLIYWICKNKLDLFDGIKRSIVTTILTVIISIVIIVQTYNMIDVNNVTSSESSFMQVQWSPSLTMASMTPLGYQYYDLVQTISKASSKIALDEKLRVEQWLQWNQEDLPANEYSGMLRGKNLLFLQFESLEIFVINQKINNQEITPNVNKLINQGIYFPNIYEQNNAGNSVDCDFMVNTSVLPLSDTITFLTDSQTTYNSMPKIMKSNGYNLSTAHAVPNQNFYWVQNHRSLGFNNIWALDDFNLTEYIGGYRSDEQYLEQYAEKLKDVKEPFFSMIATISSHGPFEIQDDKRELKLSKELNENRLGEYLQSIHFSDKQVGILIDKLEEMGILKNTIIVLYGDHGGVHKYYTDLIYNAPLEEDWWKDDTMKVPFAIYNPDIKPSVIEKHGGQVDIMPTVLGVLGIEQNNLMGRNLLNTNRDATVYINRNRERVIVGNIKSEEERNKLQEAYDISEVIIKKDYYLKEGLINK